MNYRPSSRQTSAFISTFLNRESPLEGVTPCYDSAYVSRRKATLQASPVAHHWGDLKFQCPHLQICSGRQRLLMYLNCLSLSCRAGMDGACKQWGDGDEAHPAGDHRSAPNATWEMALPLCDLLNTQPAQRWSHLWYVMGRLRFAMRGKRSPLRSEKSWFLLQPSPIPAGGICRESWERARGMRNWDTYSGICSLHAKAFLSSFQT